MRAYVKDGRRFIEERPGLYDIVFLDAFGSESVPYHLTTREFLQAVRRSLTPKGVVVADIWGRSSNPLYDSMVRTYQDVFDELYILDVERVSNKILIALPRRELVEREELARRARTISRKEGFRFDMGDIVMSGFRHAREENSRGRILLDEAKPDGAE